MTDREALLVRYEEIGGDRDAIADLPLRLLETLVDTAETRAAHHARLTLTGDLIRLNGEAERAICAGLPLPQVRQRHALMHSRPVMLEDGSAAAPWWKDWKARH